MREPPRRHAASSNRGCQHAIYRLTCDEFDAMHLATESCCERCGRHESESGRGLLVIDHDHAGNLTAVRGLLCYSCNRIMQYFDEGRRAGDTLSEEYVVRARQRRR